jgi:hypothetical protein
MTQTAPIPGSFDLLTAQQTFAVDGNGSMNFLGVPQNQPANSRAFRVLSALFFIFSDNSNGTIDRAYPSTNNPQPALSFIVPTQKVNVGDQGGAPWTVGSLPVPLSALGTGVVLLFIGSDASAGNNQVFYALDSNREIVVPFGYNYGVWVSDSGDGTPHNLTVTMFAQIQWLEQPCNCP